MTFHPAMEDIPRALATDYLTEFGVKGIRFGLLNSDDSILLGLNLEEYIVVFDGKGGSQTRKKQFEGYKAQREGNQLRVNRAYAGMMNDEDEKESMKRQFVWLNEVLNYLPVTTMIYDGVEADDVMAYITTQLLKEDEQAVVMSTDKDFLQLVDDKTIVWSPTKKKIYNKKAVREEYGIESENILLYRILDGDSSDNIPGVYGCGIKTLIKRFPEITEQKEVSVEDLFNLCETKKVETKGKIKLYNDILEAKDQILMNQKLMQLKDVDISGVIKMQVLERFNQEIRPLNKIDFLKILLKYKVVNNFGDINDWTKSTFGNFITD
jgi:DNA polymerase-1